MTIKSKKMGPVDISKSLKYLFSILVLIAYSSSSWATIDNTIKPESEQSSQCVKIIRALERYHYLEKNLDDTMSSIILDRYLKRLDPRKQLFTQSDIHSFKQYQFRLDDELKRGNLNIAFKIFNLYSVFRSGYLLTKNRLNRTADLNGSE